MSSNILDYFDNMTLLQIMNRYDSYTAEVSTHRIFVDWLHLASTRMDFRKYEVLVDVSLVVEVLLRRNSRQQLDVDVKLSTLLFYIYSLMRS